MMLKAALLTCVLQLLSYLAFVFFSSRLWHHFRLTGDRLDPLDILRGMSASLVFVSHAVKTYYLFTQGTPFNPDPSLKPATLGGDLGVLCFFAITGYLFLGSAFPRASMGFGGAYTFLVKRFRRLAPAFFGIGAVAFIVHVGVMQARGDDSGLTYYLSAYARINSFGFFHRALLSVDPFLWHTINMAWSLTYEWTFYACVAIAVACKRFAALPAVLVLWIIVLYLLNDRLDTRVLCFLLGWAIYLLRSRTMMTIVLVLAAGFLESKGPAAAIALLAVFVRIRTIPRHLVVFAEAGKFTYSYYLVHGTCLLAAFQLSRFWLTPDSLFTVDLYLLAVLGVAISSCAATVLYAKLEMPYFIRKKIRTAEP